jgi:tripartite-type tricarboxylate transporter receptor subunit TctC
MTKQRPLLRPLGEQMTRMGPQISTRLAAKLIVVLAVIIGASAPTRSLLAADNYPNRPIRIVLGFSPGGPGDLTARFLAVKLSESLAKPVMVENKPGAGGFLAITDVLSHPRMGYDLLLCTYFDPVNTLLYRNPPYQVSDIAPISLTTKYDYALSATLNLPANTIDQLIEYAKRNPNKLNYAHLGIGSTQNLLSLRLQEIAGMQMTGVPYKSAGDSVRAVMAGEVQLFFTPLITVLPFYESKAIKILAVTGSERSASFPDVPTLKESGIPLVSFGWTGVCAASGTPPDIIDLLNQKVVEAVQSPEFQSLINKSGSTAASTTPAEFQAIIDDSVKQFAPIIKQFELKVD